MKFANEETPRLTITSGSGNFVVLSGNSLNRDEAERNIRQHLKGEDLGYHEHERSDNPDYRNGKKTKKIRGNFGETEIEVPQDRDGTFEPKVVKKRQKDISGIEQKIISLYAKGMTTRQISETIEDIYGFEVSDGMVSDITDRLLPQIEEWQKRPLDAFYPIAFIDAVHFSVRDNGQIRKLAVYVILAVILTGHKEVCPYISAKTRAPNTGSAF